MQRLLFETKIGKQKLGQQKILKSLELNKSGQQRKMLEGKCIIDPGSSWKIRWDILIIIMMMLAAVFTPWQLAFIEVDTLGWQILMYSIDGAFFLDIFVTFFTA